MPESNSLGASLWRGLRTAGRFYAAHIWLPIGSLVIAVVLLVFIDTFAPEGNREASGWWDFAVAAAAILAVLGVVALVLRLEARETRAQKVERLTRALQEAARTISQINAEMEDGERRLKELQQQTSVQQELANLSTAQSSAIQEALKGELGRERQRSLMRDLVMVALGAVGSFVLTRLFP